MHVSPCCPQCLESGETACSRHSRSRSRQPPPIPQMQPTFVFQRVDLCCWAALEGPCSRRCPADSCPWQTSTSRPGRQPKQGPAWLPLCGCPRCACSWCQHYAWASWAGRWASAVAWQLRSGYCDRRAAPAGGDKCGAAAQCWRAAACSSRLPSVQVGGAGAGWQGIALGGRAGRRAGGWGRWQLL